ncbi:MAG: UDP-2,3-diacylglucosamine diphosphatase LpxI [Candidatus Omnitrophota bacterium]
MSLSGFDGFKKIGLIAGNGKFPLLFAKAANRLGLEVIAIAIKGDTSGYIRALASKVYWLSLKDYAKMYDIFKREDIQKVIMAGQVNPRSLFYKDLGDATLKTLLAAMKDKRPDTVFGAVADELAKHSIELMDSTLLLKDCMPSKGVLTKQQPDEKTWADVRFGFQLAKQTAGLDIGQTLCIRNGAIVAVEAIEGTDAAILRGGRLAGPGVVVIKVSKPYQDMRFDVPVVGPRTIKFLSKIKGSCLAIEAKKTLMIDQDVCVDMANRKNISIVVEEI